MKKSSKRIYLDYAATTPVDTEVVKLISKNLLRFGGNPSSLHNEGRIAKKELEVSRSTVARSIGANSSEIVFTSGGSESNNLAIKGLVNALLIENKNFVPHIVTTTIEHSSVLETIRSLESTGVQVTYLRPDEEGVISIKDLKNSLRENTVLVSIMYANNEIGSILPIPEMVKVVRHFRNNNQGRSKINIPYVHIDASQAIQYIPINVVKLGVEMITFDSSKIYGPKGFGALYIKKGTPIYPEILGGGQEYGLRSGTENVPFASGFALALSKSLNIRERESNRLMKLRNYFEDRLIKLGGEINGLNGERLPNIISVCFKGLDAEFAVYQLDERGIAVSSASTCMNLKEDSYSYVVEEIGREDCKTSSLRFSMGRSTIKQDVDYCIKSLKEILEIQNKTNK